VQRTIQSDYFIQSTSLPLEVITDLCRSATPSRKCSKPELSKNKKSSSPPSFRSSAGRPKWLSLNRFSLSSVFQLRSFRPSFSTRLVRCGMDTLAGHPLRSITLFRKLHFVVSAASYSSLNVTPSDALSHAPIGVTSRKTETSDCLAPRNNQKTQDHLGISEHLPAEVLPYSSRTWNLETGLDLLKIVSTQSHPPEVLGPTGV
jgi:hypothetical protein